MGYFDDDELAEGAEESALANKAWNPNVRAHMEKLLMGGVDPEKLAAAKKGASDDHFNSTLFQGLSTMMAGSKKTPGGFYDSLRSKSDDGVNDLQSETAQRQKIAQYLIGKDDDLRSKAEKYGYMKKSLDAKSTAAKAQQDFQSGEKEKDRVAAGERAEVAAKAAGARGSESSDMRKMMFEYGLSKDVAAKETASKEKLDTKTRMLANDLKGAQGLQSQYDAIEKELGFKLEEYDPGSSKALIADQKSGQQVPRKVDLPGVSLPGVGRVDFFNADARTIGGSMQSIFNTEIKDAAGATVTSTEMERIKKQFNAGKFNTESEMIKSLTDYKRAVSIEMRNREAGYDDRVVSEYKARGGVTSKPVPASPNLGGESGTAIAAPASAPKDYDAMTDEELEAEMARKKGVGK